MPSLSEKFERGEFVSYPTHCLVGVIDDQAEAMKAEEELVASSISNDVFHLRGAEDADEIDASGSHHGLLARIVRLVQFTTMDGDHAQRYEDEARAGHSVVFVHLEKYDDVEPMRQILKSHGGHFINWYGRLYFEVLDR